MHNSLGEFLALHSRIYKCCEGHNEAQKMRASIWTTSRNCFYEPKVALLWIQKIWSKKKLFRLVFLSEMRNLIVRVNSFLHVCILTAALNLNLKIYFCLEMLSQLKSLQLAFGSLQLFAISFLENKTSSLTDC
jgi:hypothetical protein